MKKIILGLLLMMLNQGYAVACECASDRGLITSDQAERIAVLLGTETVSVVHQSGQLAPLAFVDKNTYFSQCGCSNYFFTLADVSYSKDGNACVAKVKVKNWNETIIVQDSKCASP